METWVLISENVEETTMLNYRLVCSTLAKSAHKAFLLTRFATRRSLPTRKSLEKLLHLLRNAVAANLRYAVDYASRQGLNLSKCWNGLRACQELAACALRYQNQHQ